MIWSKNYTLDDLNNFRGLHKDNVNRVLDIVFTEIGDESLTATMPVDHRTIQPFGLLHGGSSCVLAETLGSVAAWMCIDAEKQVAVGLEIHAHHLRPVTKGKVTGICKPLHRGRTMHLWQIDTYNDEGKMNCTVRLSVAIRDRKE
ncbi:MAG TPA: hotdog fold thioesterase [Micavibrio sp.]|nr:hotdog fold thioesterase [Micavibrio sp.]